MAVHKPNVHILNELEYKFMKEKYQFYINGNNVIVQPVGYSRPTAHPLDKDFFINAIGIYKMTFSKECLAIWQKLNENIDKNKYHLIDVQQAVNKLIIAYLEVNVDNVRKVIDENALSIQKI